MAPGSVKLEMLGTTVLALCRSAKSRERDDAVWWMAEQRKRALRLEIPDHAKDEHTQAGRALGRGAAYWFAESCRLVDHMEVAGDRCAKKIQALLAPPEQRTPDATL